MATESQLKKMPELLALQIAREAGMHRRSVEQETILLLEEALTARAKALNKRDADIDHILRRYDAIPTIDPRALADLIEYDELGLPK